MIASGRNRVCCAIVLSAALVAVAGCNQAQPLDKRSTITTAATAAPLSGPTAAALRAFRDAAAAAPIWSISEPRLEPTTVAEVAQSSSAIVTGVVRSAAVAAPRADPLKPYEGAPTLYHLDVVLTIDPDADRTSSAGLEVHVPIGPSGSDGLEYMRPAAERVVASAPIGATGVMRVANGVAEPLAFESADGGLVAYRESMQSALTSLTLDQLTSALRRYIAS